ncbi:hypothetical protein [Latilactobacillus curvatus]|uniref:hypothetical protein n=1 Tax=Latilactobacillus curvatus TaxID=28038 RepID=UPI003EB76965
MFITALKMTNPTSEASNTAFDSIMEVFGSQVKSITVDHGKEFSNHQVLEDKCNVMFISGMPIYHGTWL